MYYTAVPGTAGPAFLFLLGHNTHGADPTPGSALYSPALRPMVYTSHIQLYVTCTLHVEMLAPRGSFSNELTTYLQWAGVVALFVLLVVFLATGTPPGAPDGALAD